MDSFGHWKIAYFGDDGPGGGCCSSMGQFWRGKEAELRPLLTRWMLQQHLQWGGAYRTTIKATFLDGGTKTIEQSVSKGKAFSVLDMAKHRLLAKRRKKEG